MSRVPELAGDRLTIGLAASASSGNAMFLSELMACVVAIGVVVYFAVDEYADRIRAARFSEPLMNAGTYARLWVEEHALSGRPPLDSVAYDRGPPDATDQAIVPVSDALGSVSGLEALRARAAQGADAGQTAASASEGAAIANAFAGISDGVPMVVVQRRYFARPVIVELRPAMQSADAPVVRWLCSEGPPPDGWTAPPARGPRPPDELLPSVCRKGWKP